MVGKLKKLIKIWHDKDNVENPCFVQIFVFDSAKHCLLNETYNKANYLSLSILSSEISDTTKTKLFSNMKEICVVLHYFEIILFSSKIKFLIHVLLTSNIRTVLNFKIFSVFLKKKNSFIWKLRILSKLIFRYVHMINREYHKGVFLYLQIHWWLWI